MLRSRAEPDMSPADPVPLDYPERVRAVRRRLGLTQTELAERVGVSFATVNRWENRHTRPARMAWRQVASLEAEAAEREWMVREPTAEESMVDFSSEPEVVTAVAEAERLSHGYLSNPAFAAEISSVDPLPHQRVAVYERMLKQRPLRFLLADDAGAGKTIMTGLYLREVFARRLVKRVLIVPPAGLVGNWEREMRTLFRLGFRILGRAGERPENPFVGPESDLLIAGVDTLAGEGVFGKLRDAVGAGAAEPYDLVVFDEAHKLSVSREGGFRERRTARYRLAAALAGLPGGGPRWRLGWSAANLLLLTATPHMGKDYPYYGLWRLLAPHALPSMDAFPDFSRAEKDRFFIRRTKEEMVRFDGRPLYPQRRCDTLSYRLSPPEQDLYDGTTKYIEEAYNRAAGLNRGAAQLAMTVFQRRLASSTHALMRSFERRIEKLAHAVALVRAGRLEELEARQRRLGKTEDYFEAHTADEDADGDGEASARFEEDALGGLIALSLADLREERERVEDLLEQARALASRGKDAKLERLTEVLRDPRYRGEKVIVFTEHRDTADFLVGRLEGMGFTGQVATIHGGLDYRERERQVEFFRRSSADGGACYLVATDAAGEGINLQFCWLMINYDVPWNPARLEQRMGRIHRYGQKRDPVVIVNLIAGDTREGRVVGALLEKLERIRERLGSDKVFDVVGRLFRGFSLRSYLQRAVTDEGAEEAITEIDGVLAEERVRAEEERERSLFGAGDVAARLPALEESLERERFRRLLPGYVRRFVQSAAPLLDLRITGDLDSGFGFDPMRAGAGDFLFRAVGFYPIANRASFSVRRPGEGEEATWMHPGEPVFEAFCSCLRSRYRPHALRGAIFLDPAATEPYLFHLAGLSIRRRRPARRSFDRAASAEDERARFDIVERRLVGVRQDNEGQVAKMAVEHLLLLQGAGDALPGAVAVARRARTLVAEAEEWLRAEELAGLVADWRSDAERAAEGELAWVNRGFDYRMADLVAERQRARRAARNGEPDAEERLAEVKEEQRRFHERRERRLARLRREPALIEPGEVEMLAHALVLPTRDPESERRLEVEVERVAMRVAAAHEEAEGRTVHDVSRPELARRVGLPDWPGFDLHSAGPGRANGPADIRGIEVKGRAGAEGVQISENEWARACNLRDRYWIYAVLDCATPRPRLIRVRDPFGKLLARRRESVAVSVADLLQAAEPESGVGTAAGRRPDGGGR